MISWVIFLAWLGLGSQMVTRFDDAPLGPWAPVDSNAYVWTINLTSDTVAFFAQAPNVDSATRFLGIVPPRDSGRFKLPYADTQVRIRGAALLPGFGTLDVFGPGEGRVQVSP